MNFFHSLFKSKLDAMRAAAPRATIHLLHESNGFSIYLDEATAVRHVTQLGTLTDHAEDVLLDNPVSVLFIPLEQCVKFIEEVTASHSVALVDVILADKVHAARYVMYAYFPRCSRLGTFQDHADELDAIPRFSKDAALKVARDAFFSPEAKAKWEEEQEEIRKACTLSDTKESYPQPKQTKSAEKTRILALSKESNEADFWG
jgi:hypothetical protein